MDIQCAVIVNLRSHNCKRKLKIPTKRSQKWSCGNQLIYRCLSKRSTGRGQDPESQADSQLAMVDGVWSW